VRYKKYISLIIIFLALFFSLIPKAHSILVPLPFYEQPVFIITYLIITIIINIILEFGIVYAFLRLGDLNKKKLFSAVALVNLVIFPPTIIIGCFFLAFFVELYLFYRIIVIILILLIEWFLYSLEFRKLFDRKVINKFISLKKTALISTLANLASFLFYNFTTYTVFPSLVWFR